MSHRCRLIWLFGAALYLSVGVSAASARAYRAGATVLIAGVRTPAIGYSARVGALPDSQVLHLDVVLRMRNFAGLRARVAALSNPRSRFFQAFLTPAQITERYGPTRGQLAAVEAFLRRQGLAIDSVSPQRNFVAVSAPVAAVERAFAVGISRYQDRATGRLFYATDRGPAFPTSLAPLVLTVLGLDNYARLRPLTETCTSPPDGPPGGQCAPPEGTNALHSNDYGYAPAQLRQAYAVDDLAGSSVCSGCAGAGQSIGLLEFGSSWSQSNEQTFDESYYPFSPPPETVLRCTDSSGCPLGATQDEADLDVQVVHAIAPQAQVVVYGSSKDLFSGLMDELSAVLNPKAGYPTTRVNSISYGACESEFTTQNNTLLAIDQEFTNLAMAGYTFFVGSGDSGVFCDRNNPNVGASAVFPASDPNVTAVGGTNLLLNTDNSYAFEYAWSKSGGGPSTIFIRQPWQQGVEGVPSGPATCGDSGDQPCRMVPDVSAEAYAGAGSQSDWPDPSLPQGGAVGYSYYTVTTTVDGHDWCTYLGESDPNCWQFDGGTSAASPLWASVAAIYNEYAAKRPGALPLNGDINAQLYNLAFRDHHYDGAITDITWNPPDTSLLATPAGPGWDAATGVGSPRLLSMAKDLPGLQLQPVYGPPRTHAAVKGTGFLPGEPIVVEDLTGQRTLCQTTATDTGAFTCSTTIPATAQCETMHISAIGQTSQEATLRTFNVQCNGWSIQQSPNRSGATDSELLDVSCPTASACMAVGSDDSARGPVLAEHWNGYRWAVADGATPAALFSQLTDVSCPSASSCTAVGNYQKSSGVYVPLAERWNGSGWSIERTPNPPASQGGNLLAVSCTAQNSCTATGTAGSGTLAEHWNGSNWSIQPTPKLPGSGFPRDVSCISASDCTAVGFYDSKTGEATLAEHWNGSRWSVQHTPTPPGSRALLEGVSCTSANACMAVGWSYQNASGGALTLAERWDGTKWSIEPPATPPGAAYGFLDGVSCTSASACTAVWAPWDGSTTPTVAERWNGTRWSTQTIAPPSGAPFYTVNNVSCPSADSCTGVGNYEPSSGSGLITLAEQWVP